MLTPPPPKLSTLVGKSVDPLPNIFKPGVYQIPYITDTGQTQYYLGKTERKFVERLKEHKADIKHCRQKSALCRKHYHNDIVITFNDAKVIHHISNGEVALFRETIEINKRKTEICNDSPSIQLAAVWQEILNNRHQKQCQTAHLQ